MSFITKPELLRFSATPLRPAADTLAPFGAIHWLKATKDKGKVGPVLN
jgi:hypothetical protein